MPDFSTTLKSYYDFVKEITADELYHGLLSYGLFAEKLPPFLTGEAFCQYAPSQPFENKWGSMYITKAFAIQMFRGGYS